ncbi:MAG TPA: hypothetical protein VIE87_15555 [Pseudolabrys sp.]|jgi:hypothetical protein
MPVSGRPAAAARAGVQQEMLVSSHARQYGVNFLPQAPAAIGDLFFPENAAQQGD